MSPLSRREFFAASSAAALLAADRSPLRAEVDKPLTVALLGSGWYGMVNLRNLIAVTRGNRDIRVVGLADPDDVVRGNALDELETKWKLERPEGQRDFRETLKLKPDVVIVGSPDHWHALHAISAMNAGSDVYCEKPMCHTVDEGAAMLATARQLGRVVQIGTQRRSTPHIVRAKWFLNTGALGKIGQVKTCCYYNMRSTENPADRPAPNTLDWDLWCGPAPLVSYNPVYHPRKWRAFSEFSNGIVGDMFVHMLDTARFIMDFGWPKRVSSTGGIYVQKSAKANVPDTQVIDLDYGDFNVTWDHRTYGPPDDSKYPWAVEFYGENGVLKVNVDRWDFTPHGRGKAQSDTADLNQELADKDQPANIVPAGLNHMKNFLECVGSRAKPVADIGTGFISTGTCLLGNVALRAGRSLDIDPNLGKIIDDAAAEKLCRRDYRAPWTYPSA